MYYFYRADDVVKKLFTIEFAPRWKMTQLAIKETVGVVRRHALDKGSMESRSNTSLTASYKLKRYNLLKLDES